MLKMRNLCHNLKCGAQNKSNNNNRIIHVSIEGKLKHLGYNGYNAYLQTKETQHQPLYEHFCRK